MLSAQQRSALPSDTGRGVVRRILAGRVAQLQRYGLALSLMYAADGGELLELYFLLNRDSAMDLQVL